MHRGFHANDAMFNLSEEFGEVNSALIKDQSSNYWSKNFGSYAFNSTSSGTDLIGL